VAKITTVLALLVLGAAAQSQQRLEVKIDPRIELMAVTQVLAGYGWTGLLAKQDTPYRRDVDASFAPFSQHPAVKRFAELARAGYTFDGPAGTMICLSAPPELKLEARPEECGAQRAGGAASLQAWLEQLRDFARASNFAAFFRAHAALYARMEDATRKNLVRDYAADLEAYHGIRQASYTIIPAPLLVGNYGLRRSRADGRFDIFGVLGTSGAASADGVPQFGSVETLRTLVWHEFGHSFVNPEVERLSAALERSEKLMEPIAAKMRASAYQQWQTVAIEHVDRAVAVRLAFRVLGPDAGESALANERVYSFAYVEALAERLKEYEQHRDRYPTFHDFAPRLIAVFDELAARNLPAAFYEMPFATTINSVLVGKLIYVVPSAESDPEAQRKIADYVKTIRDRFVKGAEILTDDQALARDLSAYSVAAYGTVTGNKWLAKYRNSIPALPALAALKDAGPLRLIALLPNPQNPKLGAIAYTATDASAVPGINSLFAGPTAYVIGKGTEVLKSGDYRRQNGAWVLP
jgi:hypothetical protein